MVATLVIAGVGCSKKDQATSHLGRANRAFAAQQYQEAEIEYRNVLQMEPLDSSAIRQLGIIYYEQGRLTRAAAFLQKAAELEPENSDVQLKLGLIYLSAHKTKEAREAALQVLRKQPGHQEGLLLLTDTARAPEEIQETEQLVENLRQQDRERIGYHLALGTLYRRQEELLRAETEFKEALDLDPKSSAAHFALGNLSWARYHFQQADQEFRLAIEMAPLRSAMRLRYADFKRQTGTVQDAKSLLDELTTKAPDYLPAWVYLMRIAFAEHRENDGSALAQKILAQESTNFDALFESANLSLATGQAVAAVSQFEHLQALYERVPQVEYRLALAYLQNHSSAKAVGSLKKAISLDPDFDEAILLLADLQIKEGNLTAAIAALTQLVAQRPQNAQAHLLLARAYLSDKNDDRALAVYHRMIELFPRNPQIPVLIGMVLAKQDQRADARKAFSRSLEISPDYLPASEQLVDLDLLEANYAAAGDRARKLIQKNENSAGAWLLAGKVDLAQHDPNSAERSFLKAIELDSEQPTAYLLLAQLYLASNKKEQALEKLTALLAKSNDLDALLQIGMLNNELQHYDAAREAYEKLLAVNPQSIPALNNLACLYSQHFGQLDKSYELAKHARDLDPADPYTADTLGWILFQKAAYSQALALLRESAGKLPGEPEIQFHLGMAFYMLGEEEEARVGLQHAASDAKNFPAKEEARQRLSLLTINIQTADSTVLADLQRHLREEPNDPVALTRLAEIQERDGTLDQAVKNYTAALKLTPRNAQIMVKLAQLYSRRPNDSQQAIALAENAHQIALDDPSISWTLGHLLYNAGAYRRALSLLEEAARKLPDQPNLIYDLARAYYSLGQVSVAKETMQRALQNNLSAAKCEEAKTFIALVAAAESSPAAQGSLPQAQDLLAVDPNYVPALMVSALEQEHRGNYQEAIRLYEKILNTYPLFSCATRQLAILYAQTLNADPKAYQLAVKAREAYPEDPELAKILGILTYQRADYQLSAQLLQESFRKRSDDPELLYYLGMANYRLKAWNASKDALQRALVLNISPNLADDAKRVLAELK
jgi:tetratricopeptide (TPR) repeat protein